MCTRRRPAPARRLAVFRSARSDGVAEGVHQTDRVHGDLGTEPCKGLGRKRHAAVSPQIRDADPSRQAAERRSGPETAACGRPGPGHQTCPWEPRATSGKPLHAWPVLALELHDLAPGRGAGRAVPVSGLGSGVPPSPHRQQNRRNPSPEAQGVSRSRTRRHEVAASLASGRAGSARAAPTAGLRRTPPPGPSLHATRGRRPRAADHGARQRSGPAAGRHQSHRVAEPGAFLRLRVQSDASHPRRRRALPQVPEAMRGPCQRS
jgi:hypothetical protein